MLNSNIYKHKHSNDIIKNMGIRELFTHYEEDSSSDSFDSESDFDKLDDNKIDDDVEMKYLKENEMRNKMRNKKIKFLEGKILDASKKSELFFNSSKRIQNKSLDYPINASLAINHDLNTKGYYTNYDIIHGKLTLEALKDNVSLSNIVLILKGMFKVWSPNEVYEFVFLNEMYVLCIDNEILKKSKIRSYDVHVKVPDKAGYYEDTTYLHDVTTKSLFTNQKFKGDTCCSFLPPSLSYVALYNNDYKKKCQIKYSLEAYPVGEILTDQQTSKKSRLSLKTSKYFQFVPSIGSGFPISKDEFDTPNLQMNTTIQLKKFLVFNHAGKMSLHILNRDPVIYRDANTVTILKARLTFYPKNKNTPNPVIKSISGNLIKQIYFRERPIKDILNYKPFYMYTKCFKAINMTFNENAKLEWHENYSTSEVEKDPHVYIEDNRYDSIYNRYVNLDIILQGNKSTRFVPDFIMANIFLRYYLHITVNTDFGNVSLQTPWSVTKEALQFHNIQKKIKNSD